MPGSCDDTVGKGPLLRVCAIHTHTHTGMWRLALNKLFLRIVELTTSGMRLVNSLPVIV